MKEKNLKLFRSLYEKKLLSNSAYSNLKRLYYDDTNMDINELKNINIGKKISVIIPTFNRIELLNQCLDSIFNQTYSNFEILIIDDSNNNNTYKKYGCCSDRRIKYFKNEKNLGMGLNRQKGFNNCTGDYIIFCDDDDYIIDNQYFERVVSHFESDKDINVLCFNSIIHYEKEDIFEFKSLNKNGLITANDYLMNFQFNYSKPNSTFCAAFRKSALDISDFSNMKMMNDTSIYLRSLIAGGFCYFDNSIIGVYRVHGRNITFNVRADFIIENLQEKKYIYEILKEKGLKNIKCWYEKQISITTSYFFNGKENRKKEKEKVLYWLKDNVSLKCYLKYYLKSLIKGLKNEN